MIKLKQKKITNLINYQPFLKNNYLKNKKFKLKNILFENPILYKNTNLESNVVEFNSYENIYSPFTLIKMGEISTISQKYENTALFNYDLTYNILYQFNKIIFQYILKKNCFINGRLLRIKQKKNKKKVLILILGFIFFMKSTNLNKAFSYQKKNYFNNRYNRKKFYKQNINLTRLVNSYKLRSLNFKVNNLNIIKKEFSRLDYIQIILENIEIKKKLETKRKIKIMKMRKKMKKKMKKIKNKNLK
uniref:Uncharacterized protein n=1 Tax=Plasmopara viticola TaxID=143451 RepID=A0A6C0N9W6_PLAVT|nr:hypothetical protein [Plasmopara viticola]QHW07490.1 hypothetical protein [Plasmopara viticola]